MHPSSGVATGPIASLSRIGKGKKRSRRIAHSGGGVANRRRQAVSRTRALADGYDSAWVSQPLPEDFAVMIDPTTRKIGPDTLYGGSPPRALRLSPAGQEALREIGGGGLRSPHARALGRKLIDDGMAHPQSRATSGRFDVTAIVPAHDRVELLEDTLAAGHVSPRLL